MKNGHMFFHIIMLAAGLAIGIVNALMPESNIALISLGAGLFAYGLASVIRDIRYRTNPGRAKQVEIRNRDERNIYIAEKARSLSFIITILVLCVLGTAFQLLGQQSYGQLCLFIVCGACILYYVLYLVLRNRY